MSTNETLNLASLKMVHDELVATIEQSAMRLEQFTNDRSNGELLQNCVDGIRQIRGTLSLIQLKGVDLLADELLEHINAITLDEASTNNRGLELLTAAFFILPRYLEYCAQTSRSMAMLLIPYINELRVARRAAPLPESHFFQASVAQPLSRGTKSAPATEESLANVVRRLRHMYQTGLLKVLQGSQLKPSLNMMARALERLEQLSAGTKLANLWWLGSGTLNAINEQGLTISRSRKLLFSALDREIKRFQFEGEAVADRLIDELMMKEMLYIISLSRTENPRTAAVLTGFNFPQTPYSEKELARETEFLKGPSANTMASMAAVLNEELRATKNILERAAQGGAELINDSPELVDTLKKVAEILMVVGLVSPSASLKQEIERISHWQVERAAVTSEQLLGIADTLLYVESAVAGLIRVNLSDERLAELNAQSPDDVMANSQLVEAQQIVIEEAEVGLGMVKRALSAFVESNYDKSHIRNIVGTLNTIRGGMFLLSLPRAAAVVAASLGFVEESLLDNEYPAATQHLLETFADAVISLEYYLDSIKLDQSADTSVLQIAEESLAALGYPV